MKATAIEFRLRMAINTAIVVLGFWSPWIERGGFGSRIPLLEWLPLQLSRTGLLRFTTAAYVVVALAVLLACIGAVLRVWGTAYLGHRVVQSIGMCAEKVTADGPYRYVRNPLYLGLWYMVAAMAIVMPPSGALLAAAMLAFFLLRLILAEEDYLGKKLGESYRVYRASVPRLLPRLRTAFPRGTYEPQWLRAVSAELLPIAVFLTLAILSWKSDIVLIERAILVSFGISLVARALLPGTPEKKDEATTA